MATNASAAFGGGGNGIYPTFIPKRPIKSSVSGSPEGFVGDGDYFVFPQLVGVQPLEYRDANASLVWSILPTDINAACSHFSTFMLDSVDNLLWVVGLDNKANADLYLANINAAGTLTVVGSTTTTMNINSGRWIGVTSSRSAPSLSRNTQGVGNFTFRTTAREIVLDSSDGSLISEDTLIGLVNGAFKSTSGVYFSPRSIISLSTASNIQGVYQDILVATPTNEAGILSGTSFRAPPTLGLPSTHNTSGANTYSHLQWKGDILLVEAGNTLGSFALFDADEYLKAVDKFITTIRADQ